jgi:hypothetical protein
MLPNTPLNRHRLFSNLRIRPLFKGPQLIAAGCS